MTGLGASLWLEAEIDVNLFDHSSAAKITGIWTTGDFGETNLLGHPIEAIRQIGNLAEQYFKQRFPDWEHEAIEAEGYRWQNKSVDPSFGGRYRP